MLYPGYGEPGQTCSVALQEIITQKQRDTKKVAWNILAFLSWLHKRLSDCHLGTKDVAEGIQLSGGQEEKSLLCCSKLDSPSFRTLTPQIFRDFFFETGSLHNPGYPVTRYVDVDQAGL